MVEADGEKEGGSGEQQEGNESSCVAAPGFERGSDSDCSGYEDDEQDRDCDQLADNDDC